MPIGLQLVGRRFEDEKVCMASRARSVADQDFTGPCNHKIHSKQD